MLGILDEYERSLAFSEVAIGQIKAHRHLAIPRNYEIWHLFATGNNPAFNKIVTETLRCNGHLTEADLEQLHETYLSQSRTTERIDEVGNRVVSEIGDAMTLVGDALSMTESFNRRLSGALDQLNAASDPPAVRAVINALAAATKDMQASGQTLEARLLASEAEIKKLQENLQAIQAESLTDQLTGLGNRKFLDRSLKEAIPRAHTANEPLSLLMCDIDYFKSFNDNYGHLTGDQVLRLVSMTLRQNLKGQDIAARYGGEEFAVILPNTTLRPALTVADHIRRAVMSKELKKKSTGEILGRITISVGVAMLHPGDDMQSLIERADDCLYAAKRNGRNRVVCEADPEYSSECRMHIA